MRAACSPSTHRSARSPWLTVSMRIQDGHRIIHRRCRQSIAYTDPVSRYERADVSATSRPASNLSTFRAELGARQLAFSCSQINIKVIFPCPSRRNLNADEMKCRFRFSAGRTILDPRPSSLKSTVESLLSRMC